MFIKGSELDFKADYYAVADRIHIDEGCRDSISVNIEHTGDTLNITPCGYDGSAYIITDDIGVVRGEITLVRMLFLGHDKVLYIIDKGELAYRDGDKAYVINSKGDVREISPEEQGRKVYWYDCEKSIYGHANTYLTYQTQMDYRTIDKYLFNFIITFSMKYEADTATMRYYGVSDEMTREYGVKYIKKSDIPVIDNSKADMENSEYITEDELEELEGYGSGDPVDTDGGVEDDDEYEDDVFTYDDTDDEDDEDDTYETDDDLDYEEDEE